MKIPLYKVIYEKILEQINGGVLAKGDKIPSEKELAEQFGVSRITSKKALDLLAQEQFIERIQGKGSFVADIYGQINNPSSPVKVGEQEIYVNTKPKIGLVISDFSDRFGSTLVKAIEKNVTARNGSLLIKITKENLEGEEKAIQDLLEAGISGIIILPIHGEHYNHKILELVLKKFPVVLVDRYLRGIQIASVVTDNFKATKEATEYLVSLGHEHIAYITAPYEGTTVLEDRLKGYQFAFTKHQLDLNLKYTFESMASDFVLQERSQSEFTSELERMKQFIENNPEITAFVVCRYGLAKILLHVIHLLGKKVPEDYSIICFDSPPTDISEPLFTHIAQNEENMGGKSVELLFNQIEGITEVVTEIIDFDIIEGRSTEKLKENI